MALVEFLEVVAGVAVVVVPLIGVQTFWIARALDRVESRLDRIETLLADHGERIARLEERQRARA
jgi:predicted polyphosphate/ATP-dependent NAD kinase